MTPEEKNELAGKYARVFLATEDGKAVLADLRSKFGLKRLSFERGKPFKHDALAAAIRDGERGVMLEIENAILIGAPLNGLNL